MSGIRALKNGDGVMYRQYWVLFPGVTIPKVCNR